MSNYFCRFAEVELSLCTTALSHSLCTTALSSGVREQERRNEEDHSDPEALINPSFSTPSLLLYYLSFFHFTKKFHLYFHRRKRMISLSHLFLLHLLILFVTLHHSRGSFLAEPVEAQPLNPGDSSMPNTVPAFPAQTQPQTCRLDLSVELFGGVREACGRDLDRSRCCPVLAAWLFAAHARSALEISAPAPVSEADLPMMPDDSQKCVNSLQSSLISRNIRIPQPNASCDAIMCFCGIRLHQISSLSCPAAFNSNGSHNATPTAAVRNLEKNCRNSSYSGCTECLGALHKIQATGSVAGTDRGSKMFNRDCQLMGLTWLLAKNKTTYIPTVSAVLRAIMFSAHPPHESKCSPDQENMPLAVDSMQLAKAELSSLPSISFIPTLPLFVFLSFLS